MIVNAMENNGRSLNRRQLVSNVNVADCRGEFYLVFARGVSRHAPTMGPDSNSVVGLELSEAIPLATPLSLRCIQTHGRRFLLARPPFYWAFLGVVCSIPCDLPYGLRHHVIFGPAQVGHVA